MTVRKPNLLLAKLAPFLSCAGYRVPESLNSGHSLFEYTGIFSVLDYFKSPIILNSFTNVLIFRCLLLLSISCYCLPGNCIPLQMPLWQFTFLISECLVSQLRYTSRNIISQCRSYGFRRPVCF